jgi:hypothetical protein
MSNWQYSHSQLCASRNVKVALFYVVFCGVCVFLSWKPSRALPGPDRLLPFGLLVAIVILGQVAFAVKCVRERVVVGAIMASLLSDLVAAVAPGIVSPVAGLLKTGDYLLWGLAIMISLSMFVSSIRSRAPQSQ